MPLCDTEEDDRAEELDERSRLQYLAVLQYLESKELFESLAALEHETGLKYEEGSLPVASVIETSLDMFERYRSHAEGEGDNGNAGARDPEEELQRLERGVSCTGPCDKGTGPEEPLSANVTAVAWAVIDYDELFALAATADKRLRLLGANGEILAELGGLASPLLGLDVSPSSPAALAALGGHQEVLATAMGGEVLLLRLRRPPAAAGDEGCGEKPFSPPPRQGWSIEVGQCFKDHMKHATSGRFAPPREENSPSCYFVTASRDHQAKLYARAAVNGEGASWGDFSLIETVRMVGEVTSCCWVGCETFVLAARDDHQLHYWDVSAGPSGKPCERLKTNLNALGDSIVSFTVLALAVSPDRQWIAACNDKSRVIVLQAFSNRQLRNLYGAVIQEYDVPSICFSHDKTFLYATSSLPQVRRPASGDDDRAEVPVGMCGEVAVFEMRTAAVVLRLPCHQKPVRCLDRHPYQEALVTGSFDKMVHYWG